MIVLLVCDAGNIQSFDYIERTFNLIKAESSIPDVKILIVINKIDLVEEEYEFPENILSFAKIHQLVFFKVSTKLNQGLDELFNAIVNLKFEIKELHKSSFLLSSSAHAEMNAEHNNKKSKCC